MKFILKYSLLLLLLASASSCKKWLELKPQDGIIREEFWKTKEQVDAAVTGIYSSMMGGTVSNNLAVERALPEYFFLWGEARADMIAPTARAAVEEIDFTTMNILPQNNIVNWRFVYQTINYCNTVIELAPGVLKLDPTFTQQQLDRAVGQAKAIRALMYFYLVRTFRDVPLKLTATVSDQDLTPIAKSPADSVLKQIVTDLKAAETGVPATYGSIGTDKGRITKYAVNALLADVYLWKDDYANAIAECDKIINSGQFGLVAGDASWFDKLFVTAASPEHIFAIQFDAQKINSFYFMHATAGRRWTAAAHLMEAVYGIDIVNAPPKVDIRGDGASLRAGDLTIWKYVGANSSNTLRSAEQSTAPWTFYRYAEVLLMKAEALNEQDKPLEAWELTKQVRERSGAFDFKGLPDSTSKQEMQTFLLEERQREFAFEGKRWFDVLRVAKRNNYQRLDLLLEMAGTSVPPDKQQSAFAKLKDKNSHYLPIYLYEVQTNKLLEQNPFYK
ncbi:RagB/SusD family nutrient uptake outer membrane protein [Phnomibacter ginsenosidimutans]|uniref:RagB/SusD family nutrient uptake outer membrane protein n=1 Tax=Phnomibacter ginsenosidimutans TaxID=2676868 RepID=A0A6I6G874_9BACT|nr:RagB/SusD family nutrient uptake outer membrane protein [Phnomibacter ginsenosidimutans]QGW28657.1 RagB/SusD family nutrient uptake outer membrane protein [Phnomibacter ginsenosidimutans]